MEATVPEEKLGLILKLGFYILVTWIGLPIFAFVLGVTGYLIASAGSVFATAIAANGLALRVFERMPISAAGLAWHEGSGRNLTTGLLSGVISAGMVTAGPVLSGLAEVVPDPSQRPAFSAFLFVSAILLFGAIGEELLFRGYGFQVLVKTIGRLATLVATALLFGAVHFSNVNATPLGIANTAGFGIVLGYAFLQTGELWLPIGIHFGWNWTLALAGVNVSGFKMGTTGYVLRWKLSDLWSGGAYGPEASVLTCIVVLLLLVFLHRAPLVRYDAPLLIERRLEV